MKYMVEESFKAIPIAVIGGKRGWSDHREAMKAAVIHKAAESTDHPQHLFRVVERE